MTQAYIGPLTFKAEAGCSAKVEEEFRKRDKTGRLRFSVKVVNDDNGDGFVVEIGKMEAFVDGRKVSSGENSSSSALMLS